MKDEWGNEAYYDFKNIQIILPQSMFSWATDVTGVMIEGSISLYTFSAFMNGGEILDYSIAGNDGTLVSDTNVVIGCHNNSIGVTSYGQAHDVDADLFKLKSPTNIFLQSFNYDGGLYYGCYGNVIGINSFENYFGNNCVNNFIYNNCVGNVLYNGVTSVILNSTCNKNIFYSDCSYIKMGSTCYSNIFYSGASKVNCGHYVRECLIYASSSEIEDNSSVISLGTNCHTIHVGENCRNVTVSSGFSNINIGSNVVKFKLNSDNVSNTSKKNIDVLTYINGINPTVDLVYTIDTERDCTSTLTIGNTTDGNLVAFNICDTYEALSSAMALADEINGEEV